MHGSPAERNSSCFRQALMVELGETLEYCGAWSLPTILMAMHVVCCACSGRTSGRTSGSGHEEHAEVSMRDLVLDVWLRTLRSAIMRCECACLRALPVDFAEAAVLLLWMRVVHRSALSATAFVHVVASLLSLRERVVRLEIPGASGRNLVQGLLDELVCQLASDVDPYAPLQALHACTLC
jgi:hypothetical protein